MHIPSTLLSLSLALTLTLTHALSTPPSSSLSLFPDNTNVSLPFEATAPLDASNDLEATLGSSITCYPQKPGRIYKVPPHFQKCGLALRKLPQSSVTGTFRAGQSVGDSFVLPRTASAGSCTITVDLVNQALSAQGNWLAIGLAATQLTMACTPVSDAAAGNGGETFTGQADGIRVTVKATV